MEGGRVAGYGAEVRAEMSEQEITNRENAPELEPVPTEQSNLLPEDEAAEERQYCVFRAGRERFCLSVLDVEEVVEWPGLTQMPLAPGFLMGIFNLRGGIVPVIDIAFTESRRPDLTPRHVVVAAFRAGEEQDEVRLGIAADEVMGTCATAEPLIVEEAPRDVPHCGGMLRHEDKLALAIDLRKLADTFPVPVI
jgi:purine-binding chemotaxis protein CheW